MDLACALAALLAAAPDAGARPPAGVVVPPSIRRQREPSEKDDPSVYFGLGAPEVLAAAGPPSIKPGAWVEYGFLQGKRATGRVRISVLPPPKDAPEGSVWLEAAAVGETVWPAVVKVLVHGDPMDLRNVDRVVLYPAAQAPLELSVDDAKDRLASVKPDKPKVTVRKLGKSEVDVPAGKFQASGLRVTAKGGATKLWLAEGVPLWGLVRSEGGGKTIVLIGYGQTGAHTVVPPAPGEPDERPDAGSD